MRRQPEGAHSSAHAQTQLCRLVERGRRPATRGQARGRAFHALLSGNGSTRLAVPLDDITGVEYRRGEVLIDRRTTALRIGSLDAPGTLLELAHALGS